MCFRCSGSGGGLWQAASHPSVWLIRPPGCAGGCPAWMLKGSHQVFTGTESHGTECRTKFQAWAQTVTERSSNSMEHVQRFLIVTMHEGRTIAVIAWTVRSSPVLLSGLHAMFKHASKGDTRKSRCCNWSFKYNWSPWCFSGLPGFHLPRLSAHVSLRRSRRPALR